MNARRRRSSRAPCCFITALLLWPCAPSTLAAQVSAPLLIEIPAPGAIQELVLADGSRLYGRVVDIRDDSIDFRTVAGVQVKVPRSGIASLTIARGRVEGQEFLPADPNATRLFFGPTGRSLPRGKAYLGIYELFMPFAQVGVTDRVSVGGGTPLVFGGGTTHPFWLTPKVQVLSRPRAQAAVGVIHVLNIDDEQAGIAYAVTTFGSADNSVTAGVGWAYARGEDDANGAVAMVGAERRTGRHLKVITENYVFRSGAIVTAGVRFIGQRLSADLALGAPIGVDGVFIFPVINFVWTF